MHSALKNIIKFTIYLAVSSILGYVLYPYFTEEYLKSITSTLINIAAAVFAISGLWISQVYPEAIKAYSSNVSILEGSDRAKRIESLVLIVASSALVLVCILIFNFVSPVIEDVFKGSVHAPKVIFLKTFFLVFISLVQIKSVGSIMISTFLFSDELHKKREEIEANRKLD